MTPSATVYQTQNRALAATCIVVSLPLLFLATAWLPAIALTIGPYYRDLQRPGSPSYHQSMRVGLEHAIVSTVLYSAAFIVAGFYVAMMRQPRPARDLKVWSAGTAVACCDCFYWDGAGPWLFVVPPAIVVLLSIAGALLSARALQGDAQ